MASGERYRVRGHHHRRCRLTLAPACPCGTETAPGKRTQPPARDPGQLAERTARDQPLFIGHTRTGGVVWGRRCRRPHREIRGAREPAQLPPRHEHLRSWLPQHVPVVDEQAGSRRAGRPTARSAGSTHGESFSLHGAGAVRQADSVRPRERGPLHQRRLEQSWTVVSIGTSYEGLLESQLGWPRRSDRVRPSRWLAARFPTRSPPNRACTEVGGRPFGSILAVFGRPTSVIGFTGPRVGMGWAQGSPSLAVGPIPYRRQPASTSWACR